MWRSDGAQQRDRTNGAGLRKDPVRLSANYACADEKRASREKAALFGFAAVRPFNVRCGKKIRLERRALKDSCCAENGAAREGCTVFHVSSSFQRLLMHFFHCGSQFFFSRDIDDPHCRKENIAWYVVDAMKGFPLMSTRFFCPYAVL